MKLLLLFFSILLLNPLIAQWQNIGAPAFSAGQVQYTSLAIYAGTPYVAYRDMANLNKCTVMRFDGTNWVSLGAPAFSGGGALYPSLAIDNGFVHVAYIDGSNANRVTVKAFDGTNWVNVGIAGFTGMNSSFSNLKFDGSTPYVAYQDGDAGNKISVMKFDGINWVQVGIAGFSAAVASEISLSIMGGTPYVSFRDADVSNELTVMYFDGTNWQYLGAQGLTIGGVGKTSLANDGSSLFVAYMDVANGNKISVMKYTSAWAQLGTAGFTPGAGDYIDIETYAGNPYISYQDASYGFKANVMWHDGTSWTEIGIPGFTPTQAAFTSIAFDGAYPVVSYQDYAGATYKASVMKSEPCFDADMPTVSLSQSIICQNMPLTLAITSGNLNSADYWSVYTGSCGGTLVGSFSGSSAVLFPQGNSTYYVRGEPACVTPVACSSIAVTVTPIDSSVTVIGGTLIAVSSGGVYQWLNCGTGFSHITSATNQSYSVTANGSYALLISENGCTDTSSCYTFTSASLDQFTTDNFSFYPNPSNQFITVNLPNEFAFSLLTISDLQGQNVYVKKFQNENVAELDLGNIASGLYIISVTTENKKITNRLIIE